MKKIFLHFQICSICNRSDGLRPRFPIILLVFCPCFRYRVCLLKVQFACESNHTLRGRYNVLSGMQPYQIIRHGGCCASKAVAFCASPGSAEVNKKEGPWHKYSVWDKREMIYLVQFDTVPPLSAVLAYKKILGPGVGR